MKLATSASSGPKREKSEKPKEAPAKSNASSKPKERNL